MQRTLIILWFLAAYSGICPASLWSYILWCRRNQPQGDYWSSVGMAIAMAGVAVEILLSLVGAIAHPRKVPFTDFLLPLVGRTLEAASLWFVILVAHRSGKKKVNGQAV
ncbi:MAG: hypothetical protein WBV94_00425 [Blastocatellia bacterium]